MFLVSALQRRLMGIVLRMCLREWYILCATYVEKSYCSNKGCCFSPVGLDSHPTLDNSPKCNLICQHSFMCYTWSIITYQYISAVCHSMFHPVDTSLLHRLPWRNSLYTWRMPGFQEYSCCLLFRLKQLARRFPLHQFPHSRHLNVEGSS